VGAVESLRVLNAVDAVERERWSTGLAANFASQVGIEPTGSSIVGVPVRSSLTEVRQALTDADVAASIRAGQIRVSFHLYNTLDELDHVAATVARLI
jgi:selenocysteine lyase/cysteine desulfurase